MVKVPTPLLSLVPQRLPKILARLEERIWSSSTDLPIQVSAVQEKFIPPEQAKTLRFRQVKPGEYFAPMGWTQCWFRISIPAASRGERGRRYLYWHANGETTVYVNGQLWAGLDTAHLWCPLPDSAAELLLDCGNYQTAIWEGKIAVPASHGIQFNTAKLVIRDPQAWQIYHDFEVLHELVEFERAALGQVTAKADFGYVPPFEKCPPLLRILLVRLEEASDLLDQGRYEELDALLQDTYRLLPAERWSLIASHVGHSHVDLVWLWPEEVTYRKAIHTYATVLRLMERYPEFIFSMSQPALMRHIEQEQPQLAKDIKRRIKQGRWEATGGLEVESDTMIPCGEGLVRSLVLGQEAFRELRGSYCSTLWLPDVFG